MATATSVCAQDISAYKLGTNLNEVNDYSPQLPFKDIFKYSREWFTQCQPGADPGCSFANSFDTGEAAFIDLDADGWVRSVPARSSPRIFTSVATFWDVPAEFPTGQYIVLYEGSGTIEYGLGAQKIQAASQPGRDVIDIDPVRGGILLRISATDTGNYIRRIRVVAVGDESSFQSQPFTAAFLGRIAPYHALRFMDWMRTNNSELQSWSSRAKPIDARYATAKGVPAEVMIDLANRTGKAPWFTLPAMADDPFFQNFAQLVKDSLNPALPVFVEYSNEIWNSIFSQGAWVEEQAQQDFPGGIASGFTKRLNWHGKRTAQMCDIWKQVFGARASQVVCVLGAQAANTFTASEALSCPLSNLAPCSGHGINAVAIAPYFGDYIGQQENFSEVDGWTLATDGGLSSLFSELSGGGVLGGGPTGGSLAQSFGWIEEYKALTHDRGLALLAYEGGQHLAGIGAAGDDPSLTTLFTSANRDARMGTLYTSYLNGWSGRAAGLFMHFSDISSYTKFGSWGALEQIGQSSSPKYDALRAYAEGAVPPTPAPFHSPTPTLGATPSPGGASPHLFIRVLGSGRVVSSAPRVNCSGVCNTAVGRGRILMLDAIPSRGSRFIRWRGLCTRSGPRCRLSLRSSRQIIAEFRRR